MSPALKEIANRLHRLSYKDMRELAMLLESNMAKPITTGDKLNHYCDALLNTALAIEEAPEPDANPKKRPV